MAYKRTTGKIGGTRITRTENTNKGRTYSQSTGQKYKNGGSNRTTRSTNPSGKTTITYTSTTSAGYVTKRVLNPTAKKPKAQKAPKAKAYKAPKTAAYKAPKTAAYKAPKQYKFKSAATRSTRRRSYKTKPITMGQLKALSIIFGILVLIALFTN